MPRAFRHHTHSDCRRKTRKAIARPNIWTQDVIDADRTVKFYNDQKGYGFIAPDDGGNDVFVHATALERAGLSGLRENQKVTLETEVDRRSGKTAVSTIRLG
jgi:cold shock protein